MHGEVVAEVRPARRARADAFDQADLVERLARSQADATLRDDLAELAGDTTDDLGAPG